MHDDNDDDNNGNSDGRSGKTLNGRPPKALESHFLTLPQNRRTGEPENRRTGEPENRRNREILSNFAWLDASAQTQIMAEHILRGGGGREMGVGIATNNPHYLSISNYMHRKCVNKYWLNKYFPLSDYKYIWLIPSWAFFCDLSRLLRGCAL